MSTSDSESDTPDGGKVQLGDIIHLQGEDSPPLYLHCVERDVELGWVFAVLRARPDGSTDLAGLVSSGVWFLAASSIDVAIQKGLAHIVGSFPVREPPQYRVLGRDGRWYERRSGHDRLLGKKLTPDVASVPEVSVSTPLGLLYLTRDPNYDLAADLASARQRDRQRASLRSILSRRKPNGPTKEAPASVTYKVFVTLPSESWDERLAAIRRDEWHVEASANKEVVITFVRSAEDMVADVRSEVEEVVRSIGGDVHSVEVSLAGD